ncbi:MAG: glycerol-3-phosphate acyltransferase [Bdellovibrionia bacterium]
MTLIFVLAFCLGSIPFGLLVSRIFKVNNTDKVSKEHNNASPISQQAEFWPSGVLTFFLDVGKGVLAVFLATPAGHQILDATFPVEALGLSSESSLTMWWVTGLVAILGHCFSPWMNFKGGKGVATGLGVILVLSPISALFGVIGFVTAFLYRRIISLACIAGMLLASVTYVVLNPVGIHLGVGGIIILLILTRHEANIDALLANEEKSFS